MNSVAELSQEDKLSIIKIDAEKSRRHYLDYCHYTDRNYQSPPHIRYLISKLEALERGDIKRLMIFMPPRNGKSETVSRKFPSWYLGRNPDHNVILSSYAYSLARGFSKDNRDMIESRIYKTVFPIATKDDSRAVNDWDIADHRGGMLTAGVGGSITGYGANLFIIDDPFKDHKEAESQLIRENVWQWYRSVVLTRLEPNAKLILIMTRWHRDDLAGRILAEDKDWEIVNFPALAETDDILQRKEGLALWPERFPEPVLLDTKKKVGSRVWNALYQQHPMDAESQQFKRDWFQMYTTLPKEQFKLRRGGGIDTATSKETSADNMAMVDVVVDSHGFLYVDDVFCEKVTVSTFAKHVSNQHACKGYANIKLEQNNAGEAIKQRIDEVGRDEKTYPPVITEQTSTDKMVRAMGFQHLVENGTLKFRSSNSKIAELIEHLINFDGKGGDVDDDVDALGFAIKAVLGGEEGGMYSLGIDIMPRRN